MQKRAKKSLLIIQTILLAMQCEKMVPVKEVEKNKEKKISPESNGISFVSRFHYLFDFSSGLVYGSIFSFQINSGQDTNFIPLFHDCSSFSFLTSREAAVSKHHKREFNQCENHKAKANQKIHPKCIQLWHRWTFRL